MPIHLVRMAMVNVRNAGMMRQQLMAMQLDMRVLSVPREVVLTLGMLAMRTQASMRR